jgi:hypothetical protein
MGLSGATPALTGRTPPHENRWLAAGCMSTNVLNGNIYRLPLPIMVPSVNEYSITLEWPEWDFWGCTLSSATEINQETPTTDLLPSFVRRSGPRIARKSQAEWTRSMRSRK